MKTVTPQAVTAADDPRLHDYRNLTDIPGRRKLEGDQFFICEGPVAIERLFASGHQIRSALVLHEKAPPPKALRSPRCQRSALHLRPRHDDRSHRL